MNDQMWEAASERIMLRLPPRVAARLHALARRQTVPVAVLARMLVVEALERREREGGHGHD